MSDRLLRGAVALAAVCLVVRLSCGKMCSATEEGRPRPPVVLGSAAGSMLAPTPDGAVWNFPAGQRGRLTLSLMLAEGFAGANTALADRFIQPTDDAGEKKVLFSLPIGPDGRLWWS